MSDVLTLRGKSEKLSINERQIDDIIRMKTIDNVKCNKSINELICICCH